MNANIGLSATATGVDTITATFSPAITLTNRRIVFLRTAGMNTVTAPTFNPNGLGAQTITKNNGDALAVGDLDGDVILMYDLANTNWELLTPKVVSSTTPTLSQVLTAGQTTGGQSIESDNAYAYALLNDTHAELAYLDGDTGEEGWVLIDTVRTEVQHSTLVNITAPSVQKNGSEIATQAYADALVAGLLDDRGSYNASVNTFPASGGSGTAGAILKGDIWYISVAGTLGGVAVTVGDSVRALVDTPAQTATNWSVLETNIGYVPENVANKTGTVVGNEASTTLYLSVKGYYDYLVGLVWMTAQLMGTWIVGLTGKTTPVDADSIVISDSADTNKAKKVSLTNFLAYLKTYFDTLYKPLNASATARMLGRNFTPASGTNTTGEELLMSYEISASQITTDDYLEVYSLVAWNSTAGTKLFKIYFSPTNSLADGSKVQVAQMQFTTSSGSPILRKLIVKSNTLVRSHVPATNNVSLIDTLLGGTNIPTDITVPSLSAGFWVLISGTKSVGTDTDTAEYSYLMKRSL